MILCFRIKQIHTPQVETIVKLIKNIFATCCEENGSQLDIRNTFC